MAKAKTETGNETEAETEAETDTESETRMTTETAAVTLRFFCFGSPTLCALPSCTSHRIRAFGTTSALPACGASGALP
ncbi:hypothetical protein PAN31108_01210 [Pandoraea anhela]|uniref:Uncharacterized protein n=1 Tax=Pandoraea anhela TaxID=2508295 RepID=A0A5E4T944_9BURK|nr:hypothetical protein PAN31108_01210 [Pandoraea anhela]